MRKAILALLVMLSLIPAAAKCELTIHFLDVGQGDAAIILCDGESMIIDGGPSAASSFIYSYIRNTLELSYVDYVIATHPHEDHIGGVAAVLNAVPVDLILTPVVTWDTSVFDAVVRYADLQGAPMVVPETGDVLHLGGATVTVLHCWPEAWVTNDMSIAVRIDYGETSFIFTGDAESMAEYMMVDTGLPLKADVLKVGHHGSSSSSTEEFIRIVNPTYAVISCGRGNSYGHPHSETMATLKAAGAEVYRTDMQGTIICTSDGKQISFTTERTPTGDLYSSPTIQEEMSDAE